MKDMVDFDSKGFEEPRRFVYFFMRPLEAGTTQPLCASFRCARVGV